MDWPDYPRDQAAMYRQLAEQADDPVVKNKLLELASVCEEVANNIEDHLAGVRTGATVQFQLLSPMSAFARTADSSQAPRHVRFGRVEDGRGSLGHSATLRFPSPLIEPDVPIFGIRLYGWLHREARDGAAQAPPSRQPLDRDQRGSMAR